MIVFRCWTVFVLSVALTAAESVAPSTDHTAISTTTATTAKTAITATTINTAEDAVALATARNDLIRASAQQVAAAHFRADGLTGFVLPQVTVGADGGVAGGTRNRDYDEGIGNVTQLGAEATITQYLFGFGRLRAARRNSAASIAGAEADADAVRRDIAYRAHIALAEVWLARELVAIATHRVEQRREEQSDAQASRDIGITDGLDVAASEIAVVNAEEQLALATSAESIALEALAEVVNLPVDQLRVGGTLSRPAAVTDALSALPLLVDAGSDLGRLRANRQLAASRARGERANRLPVLSAFAGGDLRGDTVDDVDDGWAAGIRVDWHVFDGGTGRAAANAAEADALAVASQIAALRRQRLAQAAQLDDRAADLARRIAMKERIQALSQTLYQEVRQRYEAGTETLLRVNEANLTAFEAAYAVANLTYQEVVLAAELQRFRE